ncbi:MAG: 3-methyl-2-oxobutanoate dehydrogenase subunit VorB [Pirellulales bacterium]|nr:3-methyl-2-oxobutanoate dehydrogenase subunit VorB [Pirellulales bacterium]
MTKVLMSGNDAVVEGAIRGGVDCYFGYPITPQNEIIAGMAARLPPLGRVFLQSESELAAISMVHGAAAAGKRAMTTSSSPGVSLMQEGISYIAGSQLPAVVVNVQRGGPGLGNIAPAQGDYYQATRGGGNGDYRTIVLAPDSAQEMHDFTIEAFELADKYRTPVVVLSDGRLGQMMEPVELTDLPAPKPVEKPWALTGAKDREPQVVCSLRLPVPDLAEHNRVLQKVYREIERVEQRAESYLTDDARLVFVAYGTCARLSREAVDLLRDDGLKAGLLRPITLWPFPNKKLLAATKKARTLLVSEMSYGQMVDDVRLAVEGRVPIEFLAYAGGEAPSVKELYALGRKLLKKPRKKHASKGKRR